MKLKEQRDIFANAKNRIFLAPLAGITDASFRAVCAEMGAGLTYTEMVSAKGLLYGNAKTEELLKVSEAEGKAGVQLFGREPEIIAEMAAKLEAEMGDRIALFDVNMGCPVPKVAGNGEGSALMKEPERAAAIVKRLKDTVKLPVTVKFRKGFEEESAVDFAKAMEQAGVDAVAVHGRLRSQYYEGKADRDVIARVVKAVSVPVIGNGDIFDGASYLSMKETGCAAVMVARGALGNPFIFEEILAAEEGREYVRPTPRERLEIAAKQAEMTVVDKGERIAIREMRKHAAWYTKGMKGSAAMRGELVKAETLSELLALLEICAEKAEQN